MRTDQVRAPASWLRLREPADAAARALTLVDELVRHLPEDGGAEVHDLGCGTGSMVRWLAPRLPGPQRWVLYDRDEDLLEAAAAEPPPSARDGQEVTVRTRLRDVTGLGPDGLAGAAVVTASALLDMLTAEELTRLLATCVRAGCPVLVALSVTGRVDLSPADPFDRLVGKAFNAHQRRRTPAGALLGPQAVASAVEQLTRAGADVRVAPSPWRLGPADSVLAAEWLAGWLGAACEQRPELAGPARAYRARRLREAAEGRLSVTVHHQDLLALPR